MADRLHSPVHDDRRADQFALRLPHLRGAALGVPCFDQRTAIPHRMVRGVLGNSNARGFCDPDGRQSPEEPSQPPVISKRAGGRGNCRCAAVYGSRKALAVYSATTVVAGYDCVSRRDLHPAGAGRKVLVLSPARAALMERLNKAQNRACFRLSHSHTTVPNSHPTPEVIAMASAPQKVTRIAPLITLAPPACAANPPRSARNSSEVPDTKGINPASGDMAVTKRGRTAPMAKLPADAHAAWIGRARRVSEMPSSSRACAPSASWAISCSATCFASEGSSPRST